MDELYKNLNKQVNKFKYDEIRNFSFNKILNSRNPQIARVLNELGIVRELNEGVKRIYSEMQRFYLKDPVYSEPDRNSVLLVLDNNIAVRANRRQETLKKYDAIKYK